MKIMLITLPFFNPAEPPGQLALLKSLWQQEQPECTVIAFDANIDFLNYVLRGDYLRERLAAFSATKPSARQLTRARRACLQIERAQAALGSAEGYRSLGRYLAFVNCLNDALRLVFATHPELAISLSNFRLLPFAAVDLANNLRFASQSPYPPFDDWCTGRLFPKIEQHRPEIIAFSLTYLSQLFPTLLVAARLKARFPKIVRIIGGGLINCYRSRPRQSLSLLGALFDWIIFGRAKELGSAIPWSWLLRPRKIAAKINPFLETSDLMPDLPAPDYGDFDLSSYFSPVPTLPYATSLGCYWSRCAFCPDAGRSPHISGSRELARNLKKTLLSYPGALFHFTDPAVPPTNMEIIADVFAGQGASYYSFVRFESCFEDAALIRRLSSSGCRMLQFGLESASERLLSLSQKGIDLRRAERILALSAQEKILNYVYLLFGLPSETEQDRNQSLEFIIRNHHTVHFINPSLMNLPIGSPMEREPERFFIDQTYELATELATANGSGGLADEDDGEDQEGKSQAGPHQEAKRAGSPFSLYKGFISQGENTRVSARRFLEKVFFPHPLVASIMRHDPPFFRAAHALFFGPLKW